MPAFEFGPKLREVVNLTVEDHPDLLLRIRHGLMASGQIDDGKPPETQSKGRGQIVALVVRPAMENGASHSADRFRIHRFLVVKVKRAADSAHTCSLTLLTQDT